MSEGSSTPGEVQSCQIDSPDFTTSKRCMLMELPRELRYLIYDFVIPDHYLYKLSPEDVRLTTCRTVSDLPNPEPLLYVNKEIRMEVEDFLKDYGVYLEYSTVWVEVSKSRMDPQNSTKLSLRIIDSVTPDALVPWLTDFCEDKVFDDIPLGSQDMWPLPGFRSYCRRQWRSYRSIRNLYINTSMHKFEISMPAMVSGLDKNDGVAFVWALKVPNMVEALRPNHLGPGAQFVIIIGGKTFSLRFEYRETKDGLVHVGSKKIPE